MNVCENCGKEHDGSYGSGRFCSKKCRAQWIGKKAHKTAIENGNFKTNLPKRERSAYGTWKCSICGEVLQTKRSLKAHKIEVHRIVVPGPRNKGGVGWSKGLTKETDSRVEKMAKTLRSGYKSGKIIHYFRDGKNRDDVKQKISVSQIKHILEHPKANPYFLRRKGQNFAEQFFADVFSKNGIQFEREYHIGRYFLDFAFPEKMIYIEIDGEKHYWDKKQIEHDKIRTKELNDMGWTLICRIRWSEFQKMNADKKRSYIDSLLLSISN